MMLTNWWRAVQADIRPRIYPQALALIRALQAQHQPMLIISASVSLLVKAIAPVLGIEHAIGIEVKMDNDRYTGIIDGTPAIRRAKLPAFTIGWRRNRSTRSADVLHRFNQ
jgi:phosphoserine phosphatase